MSNSAVIDPTVFSELFTSIGSDQTFLNELIDTFLGDSPRLLAQMRDALAANNVDAFRRAAHSLKSNSANLGALNLSALAKELELMAKAGLLDGAGEKIPPLEVEYARVKTALEQKRGK